MEWEFLSDCALPEHILLVCFLLFIIIIIILFYFILFYFILLYLCIFFFLLFFEILCLSFYLKCSDCALPEHILLVFSLSLLLFIYYYYYFIIFFFRTLYILNILMNLGDGMPMVRYWSEVLCRTIMTHLRDLDVKITDFEIVR